jgi:hypothetical protein
MESLFLWQNVGGGLMTVAPAITYSLKARRSLASDPVLEHAVLGSGCGRSPTGAS